jgi:hypothetical protein
MEWWMAVAAPGLLALVAGVFVLMLLLVKVLWAWTIPDLFPGAVRQGLIAATISWLTALKVAIFAAVFAGFCGASRDKRH